VDFVASQDCFDAHTTVNECPLFYGVDLSTRLPEFYISRVESFRKGHDEGRAVAFHGLHVDVAAEGSNTVVRNRESEPDPGDVRQIFTIGMHARKTMKDHGQCVGRNSDAIVADSDLAPTVCRIRAAHSSVPVGLGLIGIPKHSRVRAASSGAAPFHRAQM
jgi:hypothetical protein